MFGLVFCDSHNRLQAFTIEISRCQDIVQRNSAAYNSFEERISNDLSTRRASMGVVVGVERSDSAQTQRLVNVSRIGSMVHVLGSNPLGCQLGVSNKAICGVRKHSTFPGVVGSLAGDQDVGPLLQERLRGQLQILGEGENCFGHAVINDFTGLIAISRAVGPPVVGGKRAAVVVSKLDNNIIAFLEDVGNGLESPFPGVRASAASADCLVRDIDGDAVDDVIAPS